MRVSIKTILLLASCLILSAHAAIKTTTVKQLTLDKTIVLDAHVEAINQTTLASQTSGQITDIFFDAGEIVQAGNVLVKLKDENQQANFKAAKAALKATKAELIDASKSLKRIKNIFAKKLTSQQTLDNAKARYNIAKANHDRAVAQLNSAKEQLNYTIIKAPYSGIVLERFVNLGEVVAPGTPLFSGTSLSQLRVVSQIPQRDIEQVKRYHQAIIELPQHKRYTPTQQNIKFYAYASPQSATFKVRINLPKDNQSLFPGMYLKAHFKTGTRTALAVPTTSIVKRAELRAVYIQDKQGKLHLRQVRIGDQIDREYTEVLAGLTENEKVVLTPHLAIATLKNATIVKSEEE